VKTKVISDKKSNASQKKNEYEFLESLHEQLISLRSELENTKKGTPGIKRIRSKIFHLWRKIEKKELELKNQTVVYGQKAHLKRISFLYNSLHKSKCEIEQNKIQKQIDQKLDEYQARRVGNIYLLGEANQGGNRFFKFDLNNGKITYKPSKVEKVIFDVKIDKNKRSEMSRLQEMINDKDISVTVEIIEGFIVIAFDTEILNGYSLDTKERAKEVKKIKAMNLMKQDESVLIKEKYVEYYAKQEEKKKVDKLSNRYIGVDLNPDCVGVVVMDKIGDDDFKIIDRRSYHLMGALTNKLGKSSSHPDQIWQNNKREYEVKEMWLAIFKLSTHYKCYNFVMEDLDFKSTASDGGTEFNRKTKNIWHRTLTTEMIDKKTAELGMNLIEVNPAFSSFIGNIMHKVFDATASACEITRRGIYKFTKGKFYPIIDGTIMSTMKSLLTTDVSNIKDVKWNHLFAATNKSIGYRYRQDTSTGKVGEFRSKSYKSNVKCNIYCK